MKNHRKSDKMVCMKKIFMFLLCSVLVMAAVRIGMLRYQDKPEDFAEIEKWIDLGREKTQQINNSLSEKLSEQNWNFEGAYDIDDDEWFNEEGILYSGNLEYTKVNTGNVKYLVLQMAGCKVEVKDSEDEDFYLSFENMKKVQVCQKEEMLLLRAVRATTIGEDKQEHVLRVYVPKDCKLEKAEFELGAGLMQVDYLQVKDLEMSVEAGKMSIGSLVAEQTELSVGAGTLLIENADLKNAEMTVGAGSLSVHGKIDGNIEAECAVGNLQMELLGNKNDFNYELQCVAGSILLDGEKYSGINEGMKIDHAAKKNMELDCAVGNVKIEFES